MLQAIRNKDMDRKEFLQYSGLVLLSLVGLKAVVTLLSRPSDQPLTIASPPKPTGHGFGSGKYGD